MVHNSSKQPRKQRKAVYNAPNHIRRKFIASHLNERLMLQYNTRSVTLIKGDTVTIMRGAKKGKSGKITAVDTTRMRITVEGVTIKKTDGTELGMKIHPSNVLITNLDLSDPKRRKRLETRGKLKEA